MLEVGLEGHPVCPVKLLGIRNERALVDDHGQDHQAALINVQLQVVAICLFLHQKAPQDKQVRGQENYQHDDEDLGDALLQLQVLVTLDVQPIQSKFPLERDEH